MKKLLPAVVALLLFSCAKEDLRLNVRYTVTCRYCAVEFANADGITVRDTIIGAIQGLPGRVDTVPVPATWNTVRSEGGPYSITACKLVADTVHPEVLIRVHGDVRGDSANGTGCVTLSGTAHQ